MEIAAGRAFDAGRGQAGRARSNGRGGPRPRRLNSRSAPPVPRPQDEGERADCGCGRQIRAVASGSAGSMGRLTFWPGDRTGGRSRCRIRRAGDGACSWCGSCARGSQIFCRYSGQHEHVESAAAQRHRACGRARRVARGLNPHEPLVQGRCAGRILWAPAAIADGEGKARGGAASRRYRRDSCRHRDAKGDGPRPIGRSRDGPTGYMRLARPVGRQ